MQWNEFSLNKQLIRAVNDLSFESPTEIQTKVIPLILGGQNVIGIAQTGTGKTAAYLLPILMKLKFAQENGVRGLVMAPTKELVLQISQHALKLASHTDLRITPLYGGVGAKLQIEAIQHGVDLLISTPGRFMEIYAKGELPVKYLKVLVLDEADRMMDMGFMPQLRKLFEVIPRKRQNLLFSATFSERVERLSSEFLEFPTKVEVTPQSTPAKGVEQDLYLIPNFRTKLNYLEYLLNNPDYARVMVFVRSKETANNIFKFLARKDLGEIRVVHSNKGQNTRINAVNQFKEGSVR
jgi:ATP-dependent RNA helicase RhlE